MSGSFVYLHIFVFLVIPILSYLIIYISGLEILGYCIVKVIVEVIFFGYYLVVKKKSDKILEKLFREKNKLGCCDIIFGKRKNYTIFLLKNTISNYAEYLGFEFNTIILALLQDNDVMAAWVHFYQPKN